MDKVNHLQDLNIRDKDGMLQIIMITLVEEVYNYMAIKRALQRNININSSNLQDEWIININSNKMKIHLIYINSCHNNSSNTSNSIYHQIMLTIKMITHTKELINNIIKNFNIIKSNSNSKINLEIKDHRLAKLMIIMKMMVQ